MSLNQTNVPDVLIIGSGPVGATFARFFVAAGLRVTMIDSGAQLSLRPGEHLANSFQYQQLPNLFNDQIMANLETFSVPQAPFSRFHSRPESRINFANPEQKWWLNMPLASAIYAVGGMGAFWTCCTPAPELIERTPLIPEQDWQRIIPIAQKLLNVHTDAFEPSLVNEVVKARLQARGFPARNLPIAAEKRDVPDPLAHFVTWSGADTVLGPLANNPEQYRDRFQILSQHRAEKLVHNGPRIEHVEVRDLATYTVKKFYPGLVCVAGGPFLTPRLLWQSGIRYEALGRFLNDNTQTTVKVRLSNKILQQLREMDHNPARGQNPPIAFNEGEPMCGFSPSRERPWHAQVHRAGRQFFYTAFHDVREYLSLTWYGFVQPRARNRITFSDQYQDRFGQPQITIDYRWSREDLTQAARMWWDMVRAARALGTIVGLPLLSPPGSTLHFQSTYRMGDDARQDASLSVVDPFSRVWGFDNLYLGGIGVIPNEMASNPTLTACALAARAVSRILERPLDELMAEVGLDPPAELPPEEPVILRSPMTATPANGSLPAAKVSAAPINWWDDFPLPSTYKTPPETMLGQIKEAGFAGTELGLNLPWWPRKVNRLLKMYGLEAVGGMWPTHLLTRPYVIEALLFRLILLYLRWVKASVVMVSEFSYSPNRSLKTPLFPSSLADLSVPQWQRLGQGLLRLQRMAERHGFTFGYHPHLGTVVVMEWQIERLLVYAPALKLAPDTGHLAVAGVPVAAFMKQHVDRIVHVHLKNIRPPTAARLRQSPTPWLWSQLDGAFTVPGDGGLDFRPVLETLKKAGYTGWIVLEAEQNSAIANPYLYARLGRAYVKEVTGW